MTERNSPPFRILVGLDFSETGDLALSEALALTARDRECELHVVHVATDDEVSHAPGDTRVDRQARILEELPPKIWERVEQVRRRSYGRQPELDVVVHARLGDPGDTLLQACADYEADLLVVGTHGRRGVRKLLMGSVAETVMKNARCPVVVVRPKNYREVIKMEVIEPPRPDRDTGDERLERHAPGATQRVRWTQHDTDVVGPSSIHFRTHQPD